MAKLNKTTTILGGVGFLALLGAGLAALFGGKKTDAPQMIEGECAEVVEDETYSDGNE